MKVARTFIPLFTVYKAVMQQRGALNWFSILKYFVILSFAQTAMGSLTTLFIGVDNLAFIAPGNMIIYQYVPSVLVSILVLVFYAKSQVLNTFMHLLVTVLISSFFGFLAVSALLGEIYLSPTWFIGLPITVITILVALFIGSRLRGINEIATSQAHEI